MTVHLFFDILAWLSAITVRFWSVRHFRLQLSEVPPALRWRYTLVLLLGAGNGAMLAGTFNLWLQFPDALGHSVLGAIIGGIVTVEIFKHVHSLRHSTGVSWALPLATAIAIGRLGCYFSGLPDYTYGIETSMPWGVDFGDGVTRHPVQLYESSAMLLFALTSLVALWARSAWFQRNGFYAFCLFYGVQRFVWEFLKPYAPLLGPLNLFHLLCLLLIGYALARMTFLRPHDPPRP